VVPRRVFRGLRICAKQTRVPAAQMTRFRVKQGPARSQDALRQGRTCQTARRAMRRLGTARCRSIWVYYRRSQSLDATTQLGPALVATPDVAGPAVAGARLPWIVAGQGRRMRIPETTSALPSCRRGKAVEVVVDGRAVQAFAGELVSTVLLAEGISVFGRKHQSGRTAGLYCGMGVCYECLVTVDGVHHIRACQTYVVDHMVIETCAVRS